MSPLLPTNRPLVHCPEWPTMFLLPDLIVQQLDQAVNGLTAAGLTARRQDVVGLLILNEAPRGGANLWSLVDNYQRNHPPAFKGRRGTTGLMLRLPSPISLRIDSLVRRVRALGLRTYRQELVGALIDQQMPTPQAALVTSFDRYRQANAGRALLPRQPRAEVLTLRRPPPGPR